MKPQRKQKASTIDRFRWTKAWQRKREQINIRDKYMCQVCIRKLYDTKKQYNYTDIGVHHITPIVEDWDLRLEDDNLICLCERHHKMADAGAIPKDLLKSICNEQESNGYL